MAHAGSVSNSWRFGSRALDVLRVLLGRPGDLLSRDEIMVAAWPGTVVEDNNLTVQISTLRRVLDQDRAEDGCIFGRSSPIFSRSVVPSYSARNRPRDCSSGITSATKSSSPPGKCEG